MLVGTVVRSVVVFMTPVIIWLLLLTFTNKRQQGTVLKKPFRGLRIRLSGFSIYIRDYLTSYCLIFLIYKMGISHSLLESVPIHVTQYSTWHNRNIPSDHSSHYSGQDCCGYILRVRPPVGLFGTGPLLNHIAICTQRCSWKPVQ